MRVKENRSKAKALKGRSPYWEGLEDRVLLAVDAGAYEYTVPLTGYEGTFDGQSHIGAAEITAPTGTSETYLYGSDGENWSDDPAADEVFASLDADDLEAGFPDF